MRIKYHKVFLKHFHKRIKPNKNLSVKFRQRLELRLKNSQAAILRDHQLVGRLSRYRAFSITGDIRAVYQIEGGVFYLYDIGTHNQVY